MKARIPQHREFIINFPDTVDQAKAIKTIKGKVSDIDKMKVEEQKKPSEAVTTWTFFPQTSLLSVRMPRTC